MSKPWWASKTVWVNLIALAATLLPVVGIDWLSPELQAEIVVAVMAVVNIMLRFVTTESISR